MLDQIIESRIVPSPTPILKSSNTVLTIYFASSGLAEVNNPVITFIFLETAPLPLIVASFLSSSKTFFKLSLWENRVICFFEVINSFAHSPRSPNSFHLFSILFAGMPAALEIAFKTSLEATPISCLSQPG